MKTRLLITLFAAALLFNCSKDDDSNQDDQFDGSIKSIKDFYNDDLVAAMEDLGFLINTGNTPPNLEGTYLFSPFQLEGSTVPGDNIGRLFGDYTASFTNQDNESLTIDFSGSGDNQVDNGSGSFISGENNQFSIFLKSTSQIGSVPVETAVAITGEVVNGGLENIQLAALMLDDKDDPEGVYIGNNQGRLIYDSDLISPKQ